MFHEPRIEFLPTKLLVGKCMSMSLASNRTAELWGSFMPQRKAIKHAKGDSLYSMQVYAPDFNFKDLTLQTVFEKWAAMEVKELSAIPDGMEPYTLAGGLYAVFDYKGTPQDFAPMYQYIFHEWLPQSAYELDGREYFELLGEKYKNNDPDSEEEIWIPIRLK